MLSKLISAFFIICICCFSCKPTKTNMADCKGERIPDCMCTTQYLPVCGCDGKTYGNACDARCAGVKTWTDGACPDAKQ